MIASTANKDRVGEPSAPTSRKFARVHGALPGPKSKQLAAREASFLAPGIQSISTLAGIAIEGGEGALLTDLDGNTFIDFVAGICVASIGHAHPALAEALGKQAERVTSGSFTTAARVELLERITQQTSKLGSGALRRTQFYSGGAEAVESALRLARAHTGKYEVLAFWGGFHGKTGGVLGLMGSNFKHGLGPTTVPGQLLSPYPDTFRLNKEPSVCVAECVDYLRRTLEMQSSGSLAAIIVEPIQGTAGNVIPPAGWLEALKLIAREQHALLIFDEMITGWGRTGSMWGASHSGVEPDIITFGKGVGNGFPVTGLITTDEIVGRSEPWSKPSFSSSSYGGLPLAMAAANAVTKVIVEEKLDANAAAVGEIMLGALHRLTRFPFVGEVRGRGLLLAIDLVANKSTREPLDKQTCEWIFHRCLEKGLLTMAYGPRVRLNPPLVITKEQALEGVDIIEEVFTELLRTRPAAFTIQATTE